MKIGSVFEAIALLIGKFDEIRRIMSAYVNLKKFQFNAGQLARRRLSQRRVAWPRQREPFLSFVVPVFNAKPRYLKDLLASFRRQSKMVGVCELILSDDGSTEPATLSLLARLEGAKGVRILRSSVNGGIAEATNRGVAAAQGAWVAFIDHDDALAPFAAALIEDALLHNPDCQFLYTDELITDGRLRPLDCFLKPAWDPVLLSGVNYINHLSVFRRDRLLAVGGLRRGFEGSQDYDLLLRYTAGLEERTILHLPYPAYLWRRDGSSYSVQFSDQAKRAARSALAQHHSGAGLAVPVDDAAIPDLHRLRFDQIEQRWPLVSVIIPSRDRLDLISKILGDLTWGTDYPELEIIVADNGSTDPEVLELYAQYELAAPGFRVVLKAESFNFSRSVNRGLDVAKGAMVLLLNNDVEVTSPDWLKEMVSCMRYSRAGVVGARLLYPDGSLQHAGVIVGFGQLAGHWFVGEAGNFPGPMGRLYVRQSFSAVTGACMLLSRECVEAVGRFDEDAFAIAYNDIDYCLRALAANFRVLWTPFATLIHHESATRGSDVVPEKIERFQREQESLRQRHETHAFEDRAINPWLSKDRSNPVISKLTCLPDAR